MQTLPAELFLLLKNWHSCLEQVERVQGDVAICNSEVHEKTEMVQMAMAESHIFFRKSHSFVGSIPRAKWRSKNLQSKRIRTIASEWKVAGCTQLSYESPLPQHSQLHFFSGLRQHQTDYGYTCKLEVSPFCFFFCNVDQLSKLVENCECPAAKTQQQQKDTESEVWNIGARCLWKSPSPINMIPSKISVNVDVRGEKWGRLVRCLVQIIALSQPLIDDVAAPLSLPQTTDKTFYCLALS